MSKNHKNIMMIAGEASGDILGAEVITELRKLDSKLEIFGVGGELMKQSGAELIYHMNRLAFLGFAEVVKHLPFIKRVQKDLINTVKEKNIKNVILIDYPGFNLNFAKKIKPMGINVLYYVSPQVWAWGKGRIEKIKKLVKKMFVVFPFEEDFYKDAGVDVEFVGHPLPDRISSYNFLPRDEFFNKYSLDSQKDILLVMPGSRRHEVEKILPESLKAAERIAEKFNMQIVIAAAPGIDGKIFNSISGLNDHKVIRDHTYELLRYSGFGIIKSGTSTLEAGLFGLPMVIVYRTSLLTYLIGKNLVNLKRIGMVNIILGEDVVPELIQDKVNQKSIFNEVEKILSDRKLYNSMREKLLEINAKLGKKGAARRAAESIYILLNEV